MWFGLFLRVCEPFGHERCSWGDWLLQHIEMRMLLRISRLQSVHSFMQKIMHSCGRRKLRTWWMPSKLMLVLILSAMGSHLNSWTKTGRPPSQKRTEIRNWTPWNSDLDRIKHSRSYWPIIIGKQWDPRRKQPWNLRHRNWTWWIINGWGSKWRNFLKHHESGCNKWDCHIT